MREIARRFYWILTYQLGLDLRKLFRSLRGVPRYVMNWVEFSRQYSGRINFFPCLHDWYEEGGTTKNEYFWQDLYVARKIYSANPQKHIDVGSRVDGFVAHVASFRDIEVIDIRPVTSKIPGVTFKQADLMANNFSLSSQCDSLSCLHALEHFGLGRYGDPIDAQGYVKGLANMTMLLKAGGTFYLATPIGRERVEFNAHRVFNPKSLLQVAESHGCSLAGFAWFTQDDGLTESEAFSADIAMLSERSYSLGIFTFIKQ